MSARLHTAAVKTLLDGSSVTSYDGESPNDAAAPYVVLYQDQGLSRRTSLDGTADWRTVTFQTTAVGVSPRSAQWAADEARDALEDQAPTVSGWACSRIRHLASQPVRRDVDVDPSLFYAVDMWRYETIPTA